eukprot:3650626-Amphidinium_carterae.1
MVTAISSTPNTYNKQPKDQQKYSHKGIHRMLSIVIAVYTGFVPSLQMTAEYALVPRELWHQLVGLEPGWGDIANGAKGQ